VGALIRNPYIQQCRGFLLAEILLGEKRCAELVEVFMLSGTQLNRSKP
jgi:hypothetical protein